MSSYDLAPKDNSYVNRPGQKGGNPVVSDETKVESGVDSRTADSDQQLERDDKEAINKDNIIDERTRGAKPQGTYQEPGDEEGLPSNDGTSRIAQ